MHEFAQLFDSDQVISNMIQDNRWPRPGYLKSAIPEGLLVALESFESSGALRKALLSEPMNEIEIALQAQKIIITSQVARPSTL